MSLNNHTKRAMDLGLREGRFKAAARQVWGWCKVA